MNIYRATFSNGKTITSRRIRRAYTHAWYSSGYHRLTNKAWEYYAFSSTSWQAQKRMERMTEFAQPDRIGFAEVVEVELIDIIAAPGRQWRHPSKLTPHPDRMD